MKTLFAIAAIVIFERSTMPKFTPTSGGSTLTKNQAYTRVEEHLEDRVERHEPGGVLRVAPGQLVPDDDHRDAAGQADHDEADGVFRLVREQRDRQHEHQDAGR